MEVVEWGEEARVNSKLERWRKVRMKSVQLERIERGWCGW